ncbi:hypothetical protein HID58_088284, partial [Brassica napus]
ISHDGLWKGRFGDGIGGCPSCKEDGTPCRNTWQHLRIALSFSDAAMHIIAEGGYEKICRQTFKNVSVRRQKSTVEIFHSETFSDMIHNHREENCW